MGEEYKKTRDFYVEKIRREGNENLADMLEARAPDKIVNDDYISGLKDAFPECKSELAALQEEVKELQEQGEEAYDWTKYFEDQSNGGRKFQPRWLAEDILEDYDFLWVRELEKLYVWNGKKWEENAERVIKEECNTRLQDEHRLNRVKEVIGIIETENTIEKHEFRPIPHKVPFKNGVLNLKTSELEQHSPDNYNSFLIPWDYDPDAQCPNIHEFLDDVTASEEDKETLIEAAATVLLPDLMGKAFMLTGKGMNGKGKYLDLVKKMVGEKDYKEEDLQQVENGRFASKELFQKLAWISDDLPPTKLDTGSTFKSIVDGTDTRGEFKNGAHFQFKNYATPIFAANEIPETDDQTDGFFRRWIIINFPYQFRDNPDEDNPRHKQRIPEKQLDEKILSDKEIRGFVNEAASALEVIWQDGKYTHSQGIDEVREMWNTYSNPVDTFIERYLQQGVTQSEASRRNQDRMQGTEIEFDYIEKDVLFRLVCEYCENRDSRPPTRTELTQKLNKSRLFVSNTRSRIPGEDSSRVQIYRGISFSDQFWKDLEGVHTVHSFIQLTRAQVETKLLDEVEKKYGQCGQEDEEVSTESSSSNNTESNIERKVKTFIEGFPQDEIEIQVIVNCLDSPEAKIEQAIDNLSSEGYLYESKPGTVGQV